MRRSCIAFHGLIARLPAGRADETFSMKDELFNDPSVLDWLSNFLSARFPVPEGAKIEFSFPAEGSRTSIAIASYAGDQKFVVKLFREFPKFFRSLYNTRRLRALGLPVPALLLWSVRSRLGRACRYATVEECIPGQSIEKVPSGTKTRALAKIATSLAALHSVKRSRHGGFLTARRNGYAKRYCQRAFSRLARLEGIGKAGEIARLSTGLLQEAGRIGTRPGYELIHARVNSQNFLVTESRAYIIDFLSVHFGDFARDLVRALHRLCGKNPENEKLFLEEYLRKVKGLEEAEYRRLEPFYQCDFHIGEAATKLRRWKAGRMSEEEFRTAARHDVECAAEALFS